MPLTLSCLSEKKKRPHNQYRGRFAPSPSGLLHFGSLVTALASYVDAKAHQGSWLVRIEDIDPPREKPGASSEILRTLEGFGLYWDEPVLFQSKQNQYYHEVLKELQTKNISYFCQCTRAEIKAQGGIYQGHCRQLEKPAQNSAVRIKNSQGIYHYKDLIQGSVECNKELAEEDFIIHRKDGLFAYQLAVVLDDVQQEISHVIRGCDLLVPTVRQLSFFAILNIRPPFYGHVPLAVTPDGYKLSKQNKAPAINVKKPHLAVIPALEFLGMKPPKELHHQPIDDIIKWAILHWQRNNIPKKQEISIKMAES